MKGVSILTCLWSIWESFKLVRKAVLQIIGQNAQMSNISGMEAWTVEFIYKDIANYLSHII